MVEKVAIIGASEKPSRYAYKAMQALENHGHEVHLVNPFKKEVAGKHCYDSVTSIDETIDTVTVYVNPKRFQDHIDAVLEAAPKRVIMNPGTEDEEAEKCLLEAGIDVQRACTLVLLSTNQY